MSVISVFHEQPRRVLLIDLASAGLSALGLGLISTFFPQVFGIPIQLLQLLILIPLVCSFLDLWVWARRTEFKGYLRLLAHLDLGYALLMLILIIVYRESVSAYGAMYLIAQAYMLVLLSQLHWNTGKHRPATWPSGWNTLSWVVPSMLLVAVKIPDLQLAYHWDEAWSYFPAIRAMSEAGPSLLPNTINPELYRGHPTFFYFLAGSWMRAFGSTISVMKILPLLLTVGLLFATYRFARRHFGRTVAILAVWLLAVQKVVIVEAAFLLPEVLLSLFSVLSLDAFLRQRWSWMTLWLTLAVMTKETALILWGVLGLVSLVKLIPVGEKRNQRIAPLLWLGVPVWVLGLYLFQQWRLNGWWLFPSHLARINTSQWTDQWLLILDFLFLDQGRIWVTATGALSMILLIARRQISLFRRPEVIVPILFILSYSLFSAFNFYTHRYTLSMLPFIIVLLAILIRKAAEKRGKGVLLPVLSMLLIVAGIDRSVVFGWPLKFDLDYRDQINMQVNIIHFCQDKGLQNQPVFRSFPSLTLFKGPRYGLPKR